MIDLAQQRELFIKIADKLAEPLTVYAIGGTAMMLLGLKENTLDIDLVFLSHQDREVLRKVVNSLSYDEIDAHKIYGARPDTPIMVSLDSARIDMFTRDILGVQFSDDMIHRAEQIHQFGNNLIIKPADIHDIIIMKSATQRAKDEQDIIKILQNRKVKWDVLVQEAENQIKYGNERAILTLGYLLERLSNKKSALVPQEILNLLWNMLEKQVKAKKKSA